MAVAAVLPVTALAQEAPQAKKWTNVDWYVVVQVQFKAGQREAALKIIDDHFVPATNAAGTRPPHLAIEHQTGRWDMTVIWSMADGPEALTWETSPDDVKWFAALAEHAGGPEKAQEILSRWSGLIADWDSGIGLVRTDGM